MSNELDPLSVGVPHERIASRLLDLSNGFGGEVAEVMEAAAAALDAQQARVEALLAALAKVRAHTSWVHPSDGNLADLTIGLLASIERIADEALASPPSVSERKE